jgi:hypothetical protein
MIRTVKYVVFFLMSCCFCVAAQTFTVTMNSGSPLIFQAKAGGRSPVTSQTTAGMGDSLILSAGDQVTLGLETNSRLIFKGPGILALTGDSSAAYLSFDQGQAFLDRVEPTTFSVLTFWVRNYMFVPVGTAAAIKVMNNLTPAVAVIEGKVLMQSPTGESLEIQTGNFGSIETSGRIVSGNLGKYSIAALEKWSGVKAERLYSDAKAASSLEVIDQEFSVIAEGTPSAVAISRTAAGGAKNAVQAEQNQETAAAATNDTGTKSREETGEEKTASSAPDKTSFEFSAGAVTVDDQELIRLVLGIDVPIWKFGVFFDLETFFNQQGITNKGWDFKDDPVNSISRKIRYIRFGHEKDPLFIKVGGLSDVTLGYGFIVDRFTNMLHYPDQKLIGAQFYLNDVSPAGITLQVMGSDFLELRDNYHGGMGAARLAVRPLKTSGLPIISNLAIGATYSYDRNVYAPARDWTDTREEKIARILGPLNLPDSTKTKLRDSVGVDVDNATSQIAAESAAKKKNSAFGIYGGDIGLPIISTPLVSLDLYAQSGIRTDTVRGWGIGAPGAALKIWRLSASIEYRHTEGRFVPGFFGPYYLDERLVRSPSIYSKADSLKDDTLNGVFGRLGFDIANVLVIDGAYQYLVGKTDADKDQRFEISGHIGSLIVNKIPKIKSLEAYLYKTNIGSDIVKYDTLGAPVIKNGSPTYDRFFERTPFMCHGYRLGFEISPGATLIFDARFGYKRDAKGKLGPNNNITAQVAFSLGK